MCQTLHIAIDGNSASGKTTVARIVAGRLSLPFLDTGLMYRAATTLAIERYGCDAITEAEKVWRIASELLLSYSRERLQFDILWHGEKVKSSTDSAKVDRLVSVVAAMSRVRTELVKIQQASAECRSVVMAGRDIGEKVLPDAILKVFLTASVEARAERRAVQIGGDVKVILESLRKRDEMDSSREVSPMRPAPDAVIIDTENFSAEQVAGRVVTLFEEAKSRKASEIQ